MSQQGELFQRSPLNVAAHEDSGSETQDRYWWQHNCTALDCLRLLTDPSIIRVVCEHHEDYIVEYSDSIELVSCKHRDKDPATFSIATLVGDGGVAHLFDRWAKFDMPRARLMTNAGLKTGALEAAGLAAACANLSTGSEMSGQCRVLRDSLVKGLLKIGRKREFDAIPRVASEQEAPDSFVHLVENFMRKLRIVQKLPHRHHVRSFQVEDTARPELVSAGYQEELAGDCYDSLINLIGNKNRGNHIKGRYLEWVTKPSSGTTRGVLNAVVEARTIRRNDVVSCIPSKRSTPTLRRLSGTSHSRLHEKLAAGGLHATRIESAKLLREAWLAEWAALRTDLPGDRTERLDIETRICAAAADAEAIAVRHGPPWGREMYEALQQALHQLELPPYSTIRPSPHHLLGAAFELTAQCHIWFSDRFELIGLPETPNGGGR